MKRIIAGLFLLAGIGLAADPDTVTREGWRVLVDTNTTTTVTIHTAAKAGQMLSGNVGGSNAIWIATAPGTNGWVKAVQK